MDSGKILHPNSDSAPKKKGKIMRAVKTVFAVTGWIAAAVFGALLYTQAPGRYSSAATDEVLWVLERAIFRLSAHDQEAHRRARILLEYAR